VSLPEDADPAHVALVEGRLVAWFVSPDEATMLTSYKEVDRITPVVASLQAVAESGYGNEWMVA
jgi:hypothetical protein